MAFSDKRIPATRMGSGLARNLARTRRHVTKGFYDDAPANGSAVVTEINEFTGTTDTWFNLIIKDLTGNETMNLVKPNFAGQVLCLDLNKAGGFTWTIDAAAGGSDIQDGTTVYSQIDLNANGDNILMLGLEKNDVLTWFVWNNDGCALS